MTLFATTRQLGGALGVAITATVAASRQQAFGNLDTGFLVAAIVVAAAAALIGIALSPRLKQAEDERHARPRDRSRQPKPTTSPRQR